MKKGIYLILFFTLRYFLLSVTAQSTEEANVTEVINRLFTAMNKGDSTMLRSVFAKQVTMATAATRQGKPVLNRENSIEGFVKQVGSQKPGVLTEEIWNIKIQIDGDFAQAWCDYAFYYDNKFFHCGIDAFHLYKEADGWKIFHLADTRRKEGCNVPEEIKKKHN